MTTRSIIKPIIKNIIKPIIKNGGVGGGASGPVLADVPTTNLYARWHPEFSTISTSGTPSRVTQINDLVGSLHATNSASTGPYSMTDALGRKFLRFEGAEWLEVLGAVMATRNCSVWMVGRQHRNNTQANYFSLKGTGITSSATIASSQPVSANQANRLRSLGISSTAAQLVAGCQLQVMGFTSRTTALGGCRWYHNLNTETGAQVSIAQTSENAEIGRIAFSPGSSGTWGQFDLYEMIVYSVGQTDGDAETTSAELVDTWSIPAVTNNLVLEGDSITQGTGTVTSGISLGMLLSDPGSSLAMPSGWRVVNCAVSGNTTVTLATRRDVANSQHALLLGGRNCLITQIGRNNFGALAQNAATCYAAIRDLLNTTSTGYLQRGYEAWQAINIATSGSLQTETEAMRTLLRDPAFLTDCLAGTGQAFEGKLGRIELPLIEVAGDRIFDTATDAADTNWYQGDSTHPTVSGAVQMATAYRAVF